MPSGKQLAFNRGEVSPAFRYKASSVAYTEGLHKLRNGYPRRGGGVSNRPGFRHVRTLSTVGVAPRGIQSDTKIFFQKRKEFLGDDTSKKHSGDLYFIRGGIRVHSDIYQLFSDFSSSTVGFRFDKGSSRIRETNLINFEDEVLLTFKDSGILRIPYEEIFDPRDGQTRLDVSGGLLANDKSIVNVEVVSNYFYRATASNTYRPCLLVRVDTDRLVSSDIKSFYIITETNIGGVEKVLCGYQGNFTSFQGTPVRFVLGDDVKFIALSGQALTNANNFKRDYRQRGILVTSRYDGTIVSFSQDGASDPARGAVLATTASINRRTEIRPVKGRRTYRLYRANDLGQVAVLVDSKNIDYERINLPTVLGFDSLIELNDYSSVAGSASRSFRDSLRLYGGVGNDTIDTRFFNFKQEDYGRGSVGAVTATHRFYRPEVPSLSGATRFIPFVRIRELMRYQQRTFASYIDKGPIEAENTLRSVIGVSRINTKYDFTTGPVVNPAHAFEFNIPLGDVSTVVAMLGADRPLIFTQQNVYMLLGADSGIITPTEINPTVIYTGGCSEIVRPVLVDNQAFFLSNDHTSLVMIAFNANGGRGVQVIETDAYAKHFLEMEIIQIAVVKSFETLIWLLTADGKLISMTMYENEVFGFALHTLSDGFIENITSARYPYMYHPNTRNNAWTTPDVEVLAATIVRDRVRTLEVMTGRDDRLSENMGFMDGFATFGTRLATRDDGYRYDLSNAEGRFHQVFDPPMTAEMANDFNVIFEKFNNLVSGYNWFEALFNETDNDRPPYNDENYLLYFRGGTLVRTPYRNIDTLASLPAQGEVYSRIDFMQRVDVGEEVSSESGIEYLFDFRANASVISLLPARLAAFGHRDASGVLARQSSGNPITRSTGFTSWDISIYVYLVILHQFYGNYSRPANVPSRPSDSGYDHNTDSYAALNNRQKALVDKMVTEGGLLNFNSPEELLYNGTHLKKVAEGPLTFDQGVVRLDLYDFSPRDFTGGVVTGQAEATKIKNMYRFSTGSKTIEARIPIPVPIQSSVATPIRVPYVPTRYKATGNERIPDQYINVNTNPAISAENKFRYSTNWSGYTNQVEGLDHLANKKVAVFADNEVISSPLSEDKDVASKALTVSNSGVLKLPNYYQWGTVGLPYRFEMESLQIETQDDRALISGRKVINKLNVALHRTREGARTSAIQGFEFDENEDASYPLYDEQIRDSSIDKDNGTFSGVVEPYLAAGWSEGGRVRITNSDPTPITVNAIYPKGIESGD